MKTECPHCHTVVELALRHGLSGALCPACNEVIAATDGGVSTRVVDQLPGPTVRMPPPSGHCTNCGGLRDPNGRRCAQCGRLYQVISEDALVAGPELNRLIGYISKRSPKPETPAKLAARFRQPGGLIVAGLTDGQARRTRQDLEAMGLRVALVQDTMGGATVAMKVQTGRRPLGLLLAALAAAALLGVGVYQSMATSPEPQKRRRPSAAAPVAEAPAKPAADGGVEPQEPSSSPDAGGGPVDVLAGVGRARGSQGSAGVVFVVDLDGWLVGPSALSPGEDRITVTLGEQQRVASHVRRAPGTGLSLYKMRARPDYALSLGDAAGLSRGDDIYVADPSIPKLDEDEVKLENHRVGRYVYTRLGKRIPGALDGAPVLNDDGLVVGIYSRLLTRRAGAPVAIPINRLTEGEDALLALIHPPRKPGKVMSSWLKSAKRADRTLEKGLYGLVEGRLLQTASCPGRRCRGHVGVLAFATRPVGLSRSFTAMHYGLSQSPSSEEPTYKADHDVELSGPWRRTALRDSPLLDNAPEALRRRLEDGALDDLLLYTAPYTFERPPEAGHRSFRVVLSGFGGRRGAGVVVPPLASRP